MLEVVFVWWWLSLWLLDDAGLLDQCKALWEIDGFTIGICHANAVLQKFVLQKLFDGIKQRRVDRAFVFLFDKISNGNQCNTFAIFQRWQSILRHFSSLWSFWWCFRCTCFGFQIKWQRKTNKKTIVRYNAYEMP